MNWKLYTFLEQFPEHYDMAFSVGPQKVLVKALSIILRISSPVLAKEFTDRWDHLVVRAGEGVLLPEFDPAAFKLFLKLMILDTWSVNARKALKLPPNQLLHLMAICRKYEMTTAVLNLTVLVSEFLKNFHVYAKTKESLLLSHSQLKSILANDELPMNEVQVFNYARSWAEEQCKKQKLEGTGKNIRLVLGSTLYHVRFPVMTIGEFAAVMELDGLLSLEEISQIVKYIGTGVKSSTTELKFKVEKRRENSSDSIPKVDPKVEKRTENQITSIPAGSSTVSLAQALPVVDTPFVCDGSWKPDQLFNMNVKIALRGLGFLGPLDADSFYDIKVQIVRFNHGAYSDVTSKIEKRIFAQKAKTFYFIFDQPIVLDPILHDGWNNNYRVEYSLKGPKTPSLKSKWENKKIYDGNNEFVIIWYAPQLAELVYTTL